MTSSGGRRAGERRSAPGEHELWLREPPEKAGNDPLTVALCYPSGYPLGMSNLGFQTTLRLFDEEPDVLCERAFLEHDSPEKGRSFDSGRSLSEFDLIAFSVSFEDDFVGLASLLEAAGIPLESEQRSRDDPIVVMGGVCAHLNAEPVAPFMDAVLVGEADALVGPLVGSLILSRGQDRRERLRRLSRIPGAYVPSLYRVERDEEGRISGFVALDDVPLPVRPAVGRGLLAESVVLSTESFFGDMFLVETSRGCARGCLFCAAGHALVPRRHYPHDTIVESLVRAREHTDRLGLVTAALLDHPASGKILEAAGRLGFELNVSSFRADRLDADMATALRTCGVRTATLAPETASEELRRIIGKPMSDAQILAAVRALAAAEMAVLRLYFMIGLPGETQDDLVAISEMARDLRGEFVGGRSGARVSVSVSTFVPKPRTPFQWLPMVDERYIRDALRLLRPALAARPAIDFSATGPREARREGILARAGRELAPVLAAVAVEGTPWKAAMRRSGVDERAIAARTRDDDEVFPWEITEVGPARSELMGSYCTVRDLISKRLNGPSAGTDGHRTDT